MAADKAPLSDLSFFRFPEVTGEVVRNIALLVLVLVLTVLLTVWAQNRIRLWSSSRSRRNRFHRQSDDERMAPAQRALLMRMMEQSGARDEYAFVHDATAFELAADRVVGEGDETRIAELGRLRQALHLNVMNPDRQLVCTRQLLPDLPVRLVAHIGDDRLDVYCALLHVDERALVIDPPQDEEILGLLQAHPRVFLLYWRETDGESMFRVTLEPMADGQMTAFRCLHAFRDAETETRSAFRLSTDLPVSYRYLERAELSRLRGLRSGAGQRAEGEGRLVDLSYGGASLSVAEPLEERGLAQLQFELHGKPVRLMLEVLSRTPLAEGGYLLRGQFRGLGAEARVRLHNVLYREQIKRLRERHVMHVRHGA